MRITIFSFTHNGAALAASLAKDLVQSGHLCQAFTMPKYAAEFHLQAMKKSVTDLTGSFFSSEDALIYIGACGIAVRAIAPFLQDKTPVSSRLTNRGAMSFHCSPAISAAAMNWQYRLHPCLVLLPLFLLQQT